MHGTCFGKECYWTTYQVEMEQDKKKTGRAPKGPVLYVIQNSIVALVIQY